MPTEVKICGLSDPENVDAAIEAGADYLGFVFFPKSPRHLDVTSAAPLMQRARGRAALVALLVDPDDAVLGEVAALAPDDLQLHGAESPRRVAAIRAMTGMKVIKAIGVAAATDLRSAELYRNAADRLLLDAKPPRHATRPGGHGAAFDWALLDGFAPPLPWMLSGGLDAQNVGTALARTGAAGVDVSSGVEHALGRKDPALIRAFVEAVRAAAPLPRRRTG